MGVGVDGDGPLSGDSVLEDTLLLGGGHIVDGIFLGRLPVFPADGVKRIIILI